MNLTYLRYFTEVASFLNISKAADALFISQPALSRTIKQFEESLGVQLFIRDNKGLSLTEAGKILLQESGSFFQSERSLIERLHAAVGDSNPPVKILYTNDMFQEKLNRFNFQYNQTIGPQKFIIERHNWTSIRLAFGRNDLDLAMGISLVFLGLSGIKTRALFHAQNMVVIPKSHPLGARKEIRLEDLVSLTYVGTANAGKRDIDNYKEKCEKSGVSFPNFVERNSLDAALVDVALGQGFTVVTEGLLPNMYKETLSSIPCPELDKIDFSLAWKESRENPNLLRIIDTICAYDWLN